MSTKGSNSASKGRGKTTYPRGVSEATPEQLLKWFPSSPYIPVDKKVEKCQKCGKPFRRISVEGTMFRICNCIETLKGKEAK